MPNLWPSFPTADNPESWEAFLHRLVERLNRLRADGCKADVRVFLRPGESVEQRQEVRVWE